jgi:alpha-mannosidase
VEISRNALQQSLRRLSNRLVELGAWRDREWVLMREGQYRTSPDAPWQAIRSGGFWPIQDAPVELRFEVRLPEHWSGEPVRCRFRLGGEALLFVNGQPLAGLNPFHQEHPLRSVTGGEALRFDAHVVSHGLFGTPAPEPRFEFAGVLVPETEVRLLYDDLSAALNAARYHYSGGRPVIAESLLEAVHRAFTRISLPREETEQYLARIAAISLNRSAENFYGNEESLASLWERWEFHSPAGSLASEQRQVLRETRIQFLEELDQLRARFPAEGGLWLTGHAHIDLAWLWPIEETRRKARRTFHTVTGLMDRYPDFCFNQSSAQLYSWIEQDDPALFQKIRSYVRAGRWEIVGGMWVEPDGNLPAGESWVRQLLFGQRFFESRFGRRARVAWLPDSFGFTGSLPQLLVSAGIPYFFTHKLTWNERNPFPYDLYWWEGIDGSRVIAHSFTNPDTGYNAQLTAEELGETWRNFAGKRLHDFSLLSFGYGDGGGGPSEEMLERVARFREFPGLPRLKLARVTDFFENIVTRSLPVWVGEQYLEYHRATFTTQGAIKSLHRQLEQALVEAETAATLAHSARRGSYPQEELGRLWQVLLLNEFHDILPGSSIHSVYDCARPQLTSALHDAIQVRQVALASAATTSSSNKSLSVDVWNFQLHDRPLLVELTGIDCPERISAEGCELWIQRLEGDRLLVGGDVMVPSLGCVRIDVSRGKAASSSVRANQRELENEHLRVRIGDDGTLISIYDKEYGREVLADRANQLWLFTDIPRQFDAWDLDVSYTEEGIELLPDSQAELVEQGPLRAAVRVRRGHDHIEIVQDYRLTAGSRLVEICTKVRWRGRRRLLRALFPLEIRTHEVWAETAFGAVARPNHRNTPWDQARFEMPAHRWIDLSEPRYGVSLVNNGKYGHSAQGNTLGISLLRSPIYPDPYADEGDHEFVYALYPHLGDWRNGTVQAAEDLHYPLRVTAASDAATRSSFLRVDDQSLRLACLKKAEDSEDVILRLYEAYGNRGQTIIETALPLRKATLVNILEEPVDELMINDEHRITVSFTPFQVISLQLAFSPDGVRR